MDGVAPKFTSSIDLGYFQYPQEVLLNFLNGQKGNDVIVQFGKARQTIHNLQSAEIEKTGRPNPNGTQVGTLKLYGIDPSSNRPTLSTIRLGRINPKGKINIAIKVLPNLASAAAAVEAAPAMVSAEILAAPVDMKPVAAITTLPLPAPARSLVLSMFSEKLNLIMQLNNFTGYSGETVRISFWRSGNMSEKPTNTYDIHDVKKIRMNGDNIEFMSDTEEGGCFKFLRAHRGIVKIEVVPPEATLK